MRALLLGLVLLVPGAMACQVTPVLEVHLEDLASCGMQGAAACDPLPAPGQAASYDGAVRWYWDVDQCTVEQGILQGDMNVHLSGASSHPAWLGMTFTPETITVPMHEYYDPRYIRADGDRVYSEKEEAFEVRFEFLRFPDQEERSKIEARDGMVVTYLKAKAEGEGARESFGIKQVAFDARHLAGQAPLGQREAPQDEEAPVPVLPGILALGAVAAWRRQPRMRR